MSYTWWLNLLGSFIEAFKILTDGIGVQMAISRKLIILEFSTPSGKSFYIQTKIALPTKQKTKSLTWGSMSSLFGTKLTTQSILVLMILISAVSKAA